MFINTELLEFIRLKNPLSSVVGKYEAIEKDCCKCPFCHSKTNSLNLFHDEIYTCFHCGESSDVFGFVSKIENLSFAETVRKMAKLSGIYTLEELKQQNVFRFWDRFLILCEHYHISADYIVREYSSDLTKEYLLRLKYSKEEPDTAPLENIMQLKYGVSKEFWNTAPEHIMEHLTAERKENE